MPEDAPELLFRPPCSADHSFFHSTFYNGRKKEALRQGLTYSELHLASKRLIERFLEGDGVQILVATPADDPELIGGFIVWFGEELLWVYVRESMREFGLERMLATQAFGSGVASPDVRNVRVVFNDRFTANRFRRMGYAVSWEPVSRASQRALVR